MIRKEHSVTEGGILFLNECGAAILNINYFNKRYFFNGGPLTVVFFVTSCNYNKYLIYLHYLHR